MADPGFPRGEGGGGAPTYDLPNFPQNCLKLKEFGLQGGGGCVPRDPLDPPVKSMPFR